jgi:hypothetical protein
MIASQIPAKLINTRPPVLFLISSTARRIPSRSRIALPGAIGRMSYLEFEFEIELEAAGGFGLRGFAIRAECSFFVRGKERIFRLEEMALQGILVSTQIEVHLAKLLCITAWNN